MSGLSEISREDLEAAVYSMFGMLRVFIPANQKGMTDAAQFLKKQAPMAMEINKKIRHDAVERTIAYLNGMGYQFDAETINKLKEAATNIRRQDVREELGEGSPAYSS